MAERYECPLCKRPLMGPNEACNGSFTDPWHPPNVPAVAVPVVDPAPSPEAD